MAKKRDAIKDILGDAEALLGIKELTEADITSIPLEALTPYPKTLIAHIVLLKWSIWWIPLERTGYLSPL